MVRAGHAKAKRSPKAPLEAARPPGEARRRKSVQSPQRGQARRHDGGLRLDLIEAALELVETSGTRGLSWREIARRANVSHSAPYRHFANKEELLAAVAEQGFHRLRERMVEQMAGATDDVFQRLEAMAIAYVEFASENPAHFRVMFGRDVPDIDKHPALREAHDATDGLFREGVIRALESAGESAVAVDVDQLALMAWSLVHGLACLVVDGRVGDVSRSAADPGEHVRSMTSLVKAFVARARA